jgi:hypothetical protein
VSFVQSQEVGDFDGHALGLARQSGLALFPDGSVGTTYFTATNDYTKGAGNDLAYDKLTLEDGSVLWFKATGLHKTRWHNKLSFLRHPLQCCTVRGASKARAAMVP